MQPEILLLSGALAVGGLALVLRAARSGDGLGPLAPLGPGEWMGQPSSPSLEGRGTITVPRGSSLAAAAPYIRYRGVGRNCYTTFAILQEQDGEMVTVYSSGVAGVHVGGITVIGPGGPPIDPTRTVQTYGLVSYMQPQPPGCPAGSLCAFPWVPGPEAGPNPICGAPPRLGRASAVIAVYERRNERDGADGFASPTCNGRVPVARRVWRDKVVFA